MLALCQDSCSEYVKLMFCVLALCQDKGLMLETPVLQTHYGGNLPLIDFKGGHVKSDTFAKNATDLLKQ